MELHNSWPQPRPARTVEDIRGVKQWTEDAVIGLPPSPYLSNKDKNLKVKRKTNLKKRKRNWLNVNQVQRIISMSKTNVEKNWVSN